MLSIYSPGSRRFWPTGPPAGLRRPSKIKSASFGKSPDGVAGMWSRSTAIRASQAPRDETDGPGLDSVLKDANRRKFDIVMAWAIDRLGRSLSDLLDTIQHLEACGVDLYLDQQAIDTTTPMGKLVFQITSAFAEFERTMIRQRVKAGLKRAVAQGVKLGRPKIDSATERRVRKQLAKGVGILKLAKSLGIGTGTVQRIAKRTWSKETAATRRASERNPQRTVAA